MPRAIPVPVRRAIAERHQAGEALTKIALDLSLSYGTVRDLWGRYRRRGESGLVPDYRRCGRTR